MKLRYIPTALSNPKLKKEETAIVFDDETEKPKEKKANGRSLRCRIQAKKDNIRK